MQGPGLEWLPVLSCRSGGIPARSIRGERLLLYIGIIDTLQSYRFAKKLEHTFKSMVADGVSIILFLTKQS